MELYRGGAMEAAEAEFRKVLTLSPATAHALLMLGVIASRTGRGPTAAHSFAQAIRLRPGFAEAYLLLGCTLRDQGRMGESLDALQRATSLAGQDPLGWSELGLTLLVCDRLGEAAACFRRAIDLKANFAAAHYNLGVVAERERRYTDAAAWFSAALSHAPTLAEAHCRLGGLLHALGQRTAALASLSEAHRLQPDTSLGRLCLAKVLLIKGDAASAERSLRDAGASDDGNAEAHRLLGNALRERGCFTDAIIHLRRAIALDPGAVSAWHDLVHARRLVDDDRAMVVQMQAVLTRPGLNDFERSMLHFALGKAFDDLEDWERAAKHFTAGNDIERLERRFDREAFRRQIDHLLAVRSISSNDEGNRSELPILIVGLPRSGTTLVEQILSSHPEVAAGGEITFWDEQASLQSQRWADQTGLLRESGRDYLEVLRQINPSARRVTDKLPFNFLWLGFIHAALPDARIVLCCRRAEATGLSIFQTRFATRQDWAYDWDDIRIYQAGYRMLMAHWRTVIAPDKLLEVDYDTLVSSQAETTARLLSFCGLTWDANCARPERNERVVRTASMWQARQPVYSRSVDRWRRYVPFLPGLASLGDLCGGDAAFRHLAASSAPG